MSWLDIWRSLQEVGLFKEERTRLEEERRKGIEEVEQKYQKESGKSESELKKQIITNLLTRLLSGDLKSPIDVSEPAAQMVTAPMPSTEVAEKPLERAPEKQEEVSEIVDPYIDTPLCTSCNDCTNINSRMFAYNENKQAYIKDAKAGTFKELVKAAEKCPARIIHPGKPKNSSEPGLDKLIKRAEPFNK
jgi:ferredoxin